MSQPIPTSYNQIIAHTIEQALALSVNAKNENAIAGFCQLHDVGKVRTSGAHWEKTSGGQCLFLMATADNNGANVSSQINLKIDAR